MIITRIIASAQHGFNHPFESFANFKPQITIEAIVQEGESADLVIKEVQQRAHGYIEAERDRIIAKLTLERDIERAESSVDSWITAVKSHEASMRDLPDRLGSLEGWHRDEAQRELDHATRSIDGARKELAIARANLVKLAPEKLRVVIKNEAGEEQSRCTVGEFIEANSDSGYDAREIATCVLTHSFATNEGAGGIFFLTAAE